MRNRWFLVIAFAIGLSLAAQEPPARGAAAAQTQPAATAPRPSANADRFVVEVEECVVMRLPLLMPAPAKLERACDPEIACVEANDFAAAMEYAAVARPRTAKWISSDEKIFVLFCTRFLSLPGIHAIT